MIVDNKELTVRGRFPKVVGLKAEYYEQFDDKESVIAKLKEKRIEADLFTFLQGVNDRNRRYNFHFEWEKIAVLSMTTYENWWKKQINAKTRNMVRKAQKKGIDIRVIKFDDDLVKGIVNIYNESPLRQGKPFLHYRKDFETVKKDHISYVERSDFIGAFYKDELIGFIKLVHCEGVSIIMQIISMIAHRDKAPTNALIARAVEICTQKSVPFLHYGMWSKRGLGEFKKHHGFERFEVLRYYAPLSLKGILLLKLGLHHKISENLPERWVNYLVSLRTKWNLYKFGFGRR